MNAAFSCRWPIIPLELGPNINKWIIAIAARKTMRTFEHVKFNHVWSYKMEFNDRRKKIHVKFAVTAAVCLNAPLPFRIAQMYRNRTRYNETNLLIQFRCWCCCLRSALNIFFRSFHFDELIICIFCLRSITNYDWIITKRPKKNRPFVEYTPHRA